MAYRRSFGEFTLPFWIVQALAWSLIGLAFTLPSVAWLLGWAPLPEPEPTAAALPEIAAPVMDPPAPTPEVLTGPGADCPAMPLPTGGRIDVDNSALATSGAPMAFVRLSAGAFNIGRATPKTPCQRVAVAGFTIGVYEVTRAQWRAVMGKFPRGGCPKPCSKLAAATGMTWLEAIEFLNRLSRKEGLDACYTIDGDRWLRWLPGCLGYRLPTETEWEYAARAGSTGDTASTRGAAGDSERNPWGLQAMLGGAGEWVWDAYVGADSSVAAVDSAGRSGFIDDQAPPRVVRGLRDGPAALRSFQRPGTGDPEIGLRVARGSHATP